MKLQWSFLHLEGRSVATWKIAAVLGHTTGHKKNCVALGMKRECITLTMLETHASYVLGSTITKSTNRLSVILYEMYLPPNI